MYKDAFIQYLTYEKRYSKHTITSYDEDLKQFFEFLGLTYQIQGLSAINHLMIRSWLVKLMDEGCVAKTVNRKLSTLRSFYKFLLREGIVDNNPLSKVIAPKINKRLPEFIEKDKINFLLDHFQDTNDFESIRNKLIIELFYLTGMRLSELINIENAKIDFYNCNVKVLGKRNKERIIPLTNQHIQQIKNYLVIKDQFFMNNKLEYDNNLLFVLNSGKKMYPEFVYRLVKSKLSLVVTKRKRSPHVLRHTFATHMLENGADLNAIKEILGHSNLAATQIYTHNTIEKLINIYKQAHPKA